jgi:hypothetical protein
MSAFDTFCKKIMKNAFFRDITSCRSCKGKRRVLQLLYIVNGFPISPTLVILMMEAICASETSVLTRATLSNVATEDGVLFSQRRKNLKSYMKIIFYCK